MKRILLIITILITLIFLCSQAWALDVVPGLKGFGTDTRGSYGAANDPMICIVTDLTDDSGTLSDSTRNGTSVKTGSLRECIDANPGANTGKIIIFEVSGTINATNSPYYYKIDYPYTAIYGQTAPSPGITLRNSMLTMDTHDVIVQHLRIRVGDNITGSDADNRDGISITAGDGDTVDNIIIDHCSVSWALDENIQIYENHASTAAATDVTVANCIISEGLYDNQHSDGPHSKGMQVSGLSGSGGPTRVAIRDNIFAHCFDRGPRLSRGTDIVFANNLIYNFDQTTIWTYDSTGYVDDINLTGNAIIGGSDSGTYAQDYFIRVWDAASGSGAGLYAIDNRCGDGNGGTPSWTEIQADSSDWDGVSLQGSANPTKDTTENVSIAGASYVASSTLQGSLVSTAGARPIDRDSVDTRIIANVQNDTGSLIDTVNYQNSDCVGVDNPLGCCTGSGTGACDRNVENGWPSLAENYRNTATEMEAEGLPSFPSSPHVDAGAGYTNLEVWFHDLADYVEGEVPLDDPTINNNDPSNDPNLEARWEFESGAFLTDTSANSNTLVGATGCNASAILEVMTNDGGATIDNYASARWVGSVVDKAGGYSNVCKIDVMLSLNDGDISGKTFYLQKSNMSGTSLGDTQTDLANVPGDNAWSNTWVTFTINPAVDIASGEAIVITNKASDSSNNAQLRRGNSSTAELSIPIKWSSVKAESSTYSGNDICIKIYVEGGSGPTENTTSPILGTADVDFESGSSEYLKTTDGSLSADFIGKNGTTNRDGSILTRIDVESLPTTGNFMTIDSKWNAGKECWKFGIYNDAGTSKLRLMLYTGAATHTYTHASGISAGTEYATMWAWDHTANTAYIDIASVVSSVWTRLGTRIADSTNDFDLNMSDSDFEIGSHTNAGSDYFDGNQDEKWHMADVITAAEFIKYAEGEYGEPGSSIQSITIATETISTSGIIKDVVIVWDRETFHAGSPAHFTAELGAGGQEVEVYYSSKVGVTETWVTEEIQDCWRGVFAVKDANVTIPSGASVKDLQGEDATLTTVAVTGTATYLVPGTFTVGAGKDITKISDVTAQANTDIYRYELPTTDNVTITADNITITGIGRTQINTGFLKFQGDDAHVRCVNFSGAVTYENGLWEIGAYAYRP